MNKLEVAFGLLRLLNERKELDTKTVARELHVSLRTAQRYLMELSAMPCVTNGSKANSYSLNGDYHLNKAIMNDLEPDIPQEFKTDSKCPTVLGKSICIFCGSKRNYCNDSLWLDDKPVSNKYRIDKLAAVIKRRLESNKCSFP